MGQIKLHVDDLRTGMFVCALDRPWAETPFSPAGFKLDNAHDIDALRRYCRYVEIEIARTDTLEVTVSSSPSAVTSFLPVNGTSLHSAETLAAGRLNSQTADLIKSFLKDICLGQSPDIQLARAAVSECVAAIINQPEAMMFLARLRGKDTHATQQSVNVCIYAIVLGRIIGLDATKLENLGTAALLHDVGLVGIPDYLLNKPGRLDESEMALMRTHPKRGRDILMSGRNLYSGAVDVAYAHHENLDGSGYPRGLHDHQINLNSRIVGIADKYAALIAARPYRAAADHLSAVSTLRKMAKDGKIDANLMAEFVAYLGVYPPGCMVELTSGEVGVVLESNAKQPLRPKVMIVRDAAQAPAQRMIDMAREADVAGRPYRIANVGRSVDASIDLNEYYDLLHHAYG